MISAILRRAKDFLRRSRSQGLREVFRRALLTRLTDPAQSTPLARVNRLGLLTTDVEAIHAKQREEIRASSLLFDASKIEASYPLVFEHEGRAMRYAYLPARDQSKGLVVLFHGHNAFLHMGPMRPWKDFDLLAPWDTFGWQRQGSWFWGEKGSAFVETLIQALIRSYRRNDAPWFCTGGSMGGFGALWHGIKYACDGLYVMCPQVDLIRKISDFSQDPFGNPYAGLASEERPPPDLVEMAGSKDSLPPLFLIQNQLDYVNPFALHGQKLVDVYNRKGGWYGLRVHPAIGHGGDGSQEEAALFFSMLIDRSCPRSTGMALD